MNARKPHPVLRVIYYLLKAVTQLIFRLYYHRTVLINPERFDQPAPVILVSNHPNTMTDPLVVAIRIRRHFVYFLANAGLFKTRFGNWFFNTFFCIPIERIQDTGGRPLQNEASFRRCDEFLSTGGCLYIAPEGSSYMERHLRTLKTGTARIAFSVEHQHGFELGLRILPVGLTYTAPNYFGSGVVIEVGEPVVVRDYEALYLADSVNAVRQLTADLETRIRALAIDTVDEAEDLLLARLETVLRSFCPVPLAEEYSRSGALLAGMRRLRDSDPGQYAAVEAAAADYFGRLESRGIRDVWVGRGGRIPGGLLGRTLVVIAGFPVFLWGGVHNFFPVAIPFAAIRIIQPYVGYNTAFKMVGGLFTFPLFYVLQTWLVWRYGGDPGLALAYLATLLPMGWLAWRYAVVARQVAAGWRWYFLLRRHPAEAAAVSRQRSFLLTQTSAWTGAGK